MEDETKLLDEQPKRPIAYDRCFLDLVEIDRRPSIDDPFFTTFLLNPERLVDQIYTESQNRSIDIERLNAVLQYYRPTIQQYYQQKPIGLNDIVEDPRDLPNVARGFLGMTSLTDAMNQERIDQTNQNRQTAFVGCLGYYTGTISEYYRNELDRFRNRQPVKASIHPRLIATYNFLTAAWSTRSHYAGLYAQKVVSEVYGTTLNSDLAIYIPDYQQGVENASTNLLARIEQFGFSTAKLRKIEDVERTNAPKGTPISTKIPDTGTTDETKKTPETDGGTEEEPKQKPYNTESMRLVDTFPLLETSFLRRLARDTNLINLITNRKWKLISALYRHFTVSVSIVETREELIGRDLGTDVPINLATISEIAAAHNLIQNLYRDTTTTGLVEALYQTAPLDFEESFPDEVVAALKLYQEDQSEENVNKVIELMRRHSRGDLTRRLTELAGTTRSKVQTAERDKAANFATGLISALFPEHIFADAGSRTRVSEEVRALRIAVRRHGREALSMTGDVFTAHHFPHLKERGIDRLSFRYAPYFNNTLRNGYVATIMLHGVETPILLHLTDFNDFQLLIPDGDKFRRVALPISHANRDFITRYLLQHLEPLKRGSVPEYINRSDPTGGHERQGVVFRRPYHIQARKPGETRPIYRKDSPKFIRFINSIGGKGYLLDDIWEGSIQLLESLAASYPDVWDMYTKRKDGAVVEIDSLILRLFIARELDYRHIIEYEKAINDSYHKKNPHDPNTYIRAQIHINDLAKFAKLPPNILRLPFSLSE